MSPGVGVAGVGVVDCAAIGEGTGAGDCGILASESAGDAGGFGPIPMRDEVEPGVIGRPSCCGVGTRCGPSGDIT